MKTVLGLLAGVGSLLREARDVGYHVLGNVESRRPYHLGLHLSWAHNFPDTPLMMGTAEDQKYLKQMRGDVDLAIGHPPCGSHSAMGNSGARVDSMSEAEREAYHARRRKDMGLLPMFTDYVKWLKPKAFALDNLPKILKTSAPPEWWRETLPDYQLTFITMANWDYGTPQRRQRLWVVGVRGKKPFTFKPPATRLEGPRSVLEACLATPALDWRPWVNDPANGHVHVEPHDMLTSDYRTTTPSYRVRHAVELAVGMLSIPPGRPWPYITEIGRDATKIGRQRAQLSHTCPVLTGLPAVHHPLTGWPLTARERARLMDWPDDFVLGTSDTTYDKNTLMKLILFTGKAVPSGFPRYMLPQLDEHVRRYV